MWKCELCKKGFSEETMAIEIRFGYVDSKEVMEGKDQYSAFYTENGWAPLCDDCAIAYINGESVNETSP